jgi:hypothetical protein
MFAELMFAINHKDFDALEAYCKKQGWPYDDVRSLVEYSYTDKNFNVMHVTHFLQKMFTPKETA